MRESTVYMVYYCSIESYHSRPNLPSAVFNSEDDAIKFAEAQGGYGVNADWIVRPLRLNPPIEKVH